MQMLKAGGVPVLTDDHRQPDESNLRGYFEFERVKHLASDSSWLHEAKGKALKVVVPLIPFLPTGFSYKILFLTRDIREIIQSQDRMLARCNIPIPPSSGLQSILERMFLEALSFGQEQLKAQCEIFEHRELVFNPKASAIQMGAFLERQMNVEAMAAVADFNLYRNREIPDGT
jgi:hypothetical protein